MEEDKGLLHSLSKNEVNMKPYKIPQIRLSYVADKTTNIKKVNTSKICADLFRFSYDEGEIDYREWFKVMYLNRDLKLLGIQTVSMGGTTSTPIDAKVIFSGALLANAQCIVLCHNHPSGNLNPSIQDNSITKKLVEGAKLLDLRIMDHIIIASSGHYSYSDEGKL